MTRDLLRFLLPASFAAVVGLVMAVALRASVLWAVLLVLYLACSGGLIGTVLGREG